MLTSVEIQYLLPTEGISKDAQVSQVRGHLEAMALKKKKKNIPREFRHHLCESWQNASTFSLWINKPEAQHKRNLKKKEVFPIK